MLKAVFYGMFLFIDSIIYVFIGWLYKVFIVITRVNLFNEELFSSFIERIFLILGVIMLFYLAYNILTMIVDPAKVSKDGTAKNMIKKVVISLGLLVFLPTLFKYMHVFQINVINSNIIGKVILSYSDGNELSSQDAESISKMGTKMALDISQTFIHLIDEDGDPIPMDKCGEDDYSDYESSCNYYNNKYNKFLVTGNGGGFFADEGINSKLMQKEPEVAYYPVLSTAAGLFALWMILLFTLDLGTRMVKLGLLQIIAPIPIIQNVTSKEPLIKTKWFNQLMSTYLEVFMKIIIIFFAMFAISLIPDMLNLLTGHFGDSGFIVKMVANVVLILGVLKFAKEAPGLLKNLFNVKDGALGSLGIKGLKERTVEPIARPTAVALGATSAMMSNIYAARADQAAMKKEREEKGDAFTSKDSRRFLRRGLSNWTGVIGGTVSGAVRGTRNTSEVKDIKGAFAAADQTRRDTDLARIERDSRVTDRQEFWDEAKEVGAQEFTDKQGRAIFGHNLAGAVITQGESFAKKMNNKFSNEISAEKLEAITNSKSAIDEFIAAFSNKSEIATIKLAQEEAVKDLNNNIITDDTIISSYKDEIINHMKPQIATSLKQKLINEAIDREAIKLANEEIRKDMSNLNLSIADIDQSEYRKLAKEKILNNSEKYKEVSGEALKSIDFRLDQEMEKIKNMSSSKLNEEFASEIASFIHESNNFTRIRKTIKDNFDEKLLNQAAMDYKKGSERKLSRRNSENLFKDLNESLNKLGAARKNHVINQAGLRDMNHLHSILEDFSQDNITDPAVFSEMAKVMDKLDKAIKTELGQQKQNYRKKQQEQNKK